MRIAQVAPLFESVPPARYGGTERVVHWLTQELVAMGHDVTLFASADSSSDARLVANCERALRLAGVEDDVTPHVLEIERAVDPTHAFDVIHFHTGTMHFPSARRTRTPSVTTMHGRLDDPNMVECLRTFSDLPLVSISDEQRDPAPWASFVGTVLHGMPPDLLVPGDGGGGYLAFLGRVSHEKRPDRAIEIAQRTRLPLKIAAKVGEKDKRYFEHCVRPLLDRGSSDVQFLGEVDEHGKQVLLGGARALLFPIDWPEPFGLAMIEALACGTPVIAWRTGSVPSIVDDGHNGFIVDSIDEAVDAVQRIDTIARGDCRHDFERRFTSKRMADDYVRIYETVRASDQASRASPESWRTT